MTIKTSKESKIFFALQNEKIVDITQVASGINCQCKCLNCGSTLIAKKGNIRIHHFSHQSKECERAGETAIHKAAKSVLAKTLKIRLPAIIGGSNIIISEAVTMQFDEAFVEKSCGEFIPDVLLRKGNRFLAVEFAVTHTVDSEKLEKIRETNLPVLEINLNSLFEKESSNISAIESFIIKSKSNRKYIYNPKIDKVTDYLVDNLIPLYDPIQYMGTRFHGYIICPMSKRKEWDGLFKCQNCLYFESSRESGWCAFKNKKEFKEVVGYARQIMKE